MIRFAIGYLAAPRLATAVFTGMGIVILLGYLIGLALLPILLLLALRPVVRHLRWRMNPVRRTRPRPAAFYQWR